MYTCECIGNLTNEDRHQEIIRILSDCKVLFPKTSVIIIYSKVDENVGACINTVRYNLRPGINKICLCGLYREHLEIKLKLTTHYLTCIEEIKSRKEGTQIFIIKGIYHNIDCPNQKVTSLLHSSYFQLLVEGYSEKKIENLVKQGILPKEIYEQRLKWYNHLSRFGFKDIFNVWIPLTTNKIPSCKKPIPHLNMV